MFTNSVIATADSNIHTKFGCEGSAVFLTCSYGYYISIVRANYGRLSISVCNVQARERETKCGTEVKSNLQYVSKIIINYHEF